jgi:hypothetical protein
VIGIEDALRLRQVDDLLGPLGPGQRHQPVQIRARDGVLGRRDRHLGQAIELAGRLLQHGLGHAGRLDLVAQLVDLLGLVVVLAQLLLDRLHLLAQEVFALVLADFRLHLRLDLGSQLEDLELLDQDPVEQVHAGADVQRVEDLLLHLSRQRRQARDDEVRQLARLGDVQRQRLQIVRQQRRQRHDLLEAGLDVALQGVDLEAVLGPVDLGRFLDLGEQVGAQRGQPLQPHPRQPLDDQPQAAVGQLEHLVDVGGRPDVVEVGFSRLLDGGVTLGEDRDEAAAGHRFVDQANRRLPRDGERHERVGEQHRVAQRQHGQGVGDERTFRARNLFGLEAVGFRAHRDAPVGRWTRGVRSPTGPPHAYPLEPRCKRHGTIGPHNQYGRRK